LYEGLGLVVLEAMIAKKLLIVSDAGALSELVKHNYNGITFKTDNLKNLLKKLLYSIKIYNTKTSLKLINNSLIFLRKNYRDEMNQKKIMAIYKNE
jgi:glycosyltransferase involved in cell wall biosynthesis